MNFPIKKLFNYLQAVENIAEFVCKVGGAVLIVRYLF